MKKNLYSIEPCSFTPPPPGNIFRRQVKFSCLSADFQLLERNLSSHPLTSNDTGLIPCDNYVINLFVHLKMYDISLGYTIEWKKYSPNSVNQYFTPICECWVCFLLGVVTGSIGWLAEMRPLSMDISTNTLFFMYQWRLWTRKI